MPEASLFGRESAFYLALWEHLDALSGQNRWLQSSARHSFEERESALVAEYEELLTNASDKDELCLRVQLETTLNLGQSYNKDAQNAVLLYHIEEWKNTLQTLGLECARLESLSASDLEI